MQVKKIYLVLFFVLFLDSPIFSSMSNGYVVRFNDFTLTLQFYDTPGITNHYLIRSDEALWDILTWAYGNKNVLETNNIHIRLHIDYLSSHIDYWGLMGEEIPEGICMEDAEKAIQAYGEYNGREDLVTNIGKIVSAMLKIPYTPPDENLRIPIFLISTMTFGSTMPAQFEKSHVFRGAMHGEMVNHKNNMRFIVFWDRESAQAYLDEYIPIEFIAEYIFEQVLLSKENVFDIFDILY